MNKDEEVVYRKLQEHMDKMPVGFPATESGVEIRILKHLFTPEEARIATFLRFSHHPVDTLDEVYERLDSDEMSKEQLEKILDEMVHKGLIVTGRDEDTKLYNAAQWVVGIFEFQVNKMTPELFSDIVDYNIEAFGRTLHYSKPHQLRVIPVGKSISHEKEIASYDNIKDLVKTSQGPYMVANCICRQSMDLMDNHCKATDRRELCIGSGPLAEMYIEHGWGREITRDELLEVIHKNEDDGLVLQTSNSQKLEFVCSCCGCCCGIIFGTKLSRRPVKFFATNHYAEVDHDLCTECGICSEMCQMDALALDGEGLNINLDRCIGCGVCVANCDFDALALRKRSEEDVPPETVNELYSILTENKMKEN